MSYRIYEKNYFVVDDDVDEFEECIKFSRSMVEGGNILNLIILPTEKCNFSCVYCYECHNGESLKEHDIDLIVEFAKKHLKGKRGLNVSWLGGEPLIKVSMIRKLSLKLLELCYSYKISYTADMTTNGYLLDSALVNELKKLHIYSYQVTIDGLCNTHDRQRYLTSGKGTWNKIIENLKDIKENCHSGVMRFVIRTNISREIYAEYKEFVNFLSSNFSRDSRFHFLFRPVSDWGNIDESVKDTFITQSEYEEIILYALNKELFNVALQIAITPGGNLCYAWKKNCYVIRANGNVGKCTVLIDDEVNQIGHISGKISNDKFWVYNLKNKPSKCIECPKYPICLKVKCKMPDSIKCDNFVSNMEKYLPMIADERYGCILYGGEEKCETKS